MKNKTVYMPACGFVKTYRDISLLGREGGEGDGGGWLIRACILGGSVNLSRDDLFEGGASWGTDDSTYPFDTGEVDMTTEVE